MGGLVYPKKYLLEKSEAPHGLGLPTLPDEAGSGDVEQGKNPAKFTQQGLESLATPDGTKPKEAWLEALQPATPGSGPVTIVAMKFASNDDADGWVAVARSFCGAGGGHGALLQDGDVVVLVTANDSGANVYKDLVVAALENKASGLDIVCSR